MRKPAIVAASIGAAALIIAAIIGIYPQLRGRTTQSVVAGTVVERDTNKAVGQAAVAIDGRAEHAVTDDTGYFRIDIRDGTREVRLHVSKPGFQSVDITVGISDTLYLQLPKQ
jgi:hypothetical protein